MMQEPEPQQSAERVNEKDQEVLNSAVERKNVVVEETELSLTAVVAAGELTLENCVVLGLDGTNTTQKKVSGPPADIKDMDEEVLQEQAQAVVEELQKRGACTTLALARTLGMEKSTELNPLLYLLLEKNVVARVTDIPPIWTLSPTFPINPLTASAAAAPAIHFAVPVSQTSISTGFAPASDTVLSSPIASAYSHPPLHTSVKSFQPARIMAQPSQAVNHQPATIITFPPIPAERTAKPIITFPPIPAEPQAPSESVSLPATSESPQQPLNAEYWQSLSQMSGGKGNRNGGSGPPFKKWKKQKNLSELQLRLLKELKERGPTRTLELSKIVGLVTCRDVNPSIYDLKQRNLVTKVNNAPPVWQLNEQGINRVQSKFSGMEVDEDDYQSDREIIPGVAFGSAPLTVNSQGVSSLSFFH